MLLSLLPVFVFLAGLYLIDTYRLVRVRAILASVFAGCVVALACFGINSGLLSVSGMSVTPFSRYVAPLIEETAKAVYLIYLIRSHRIGFHVDAAIHGFAIGAGFALVENIYYLQSVPDASLVTWIIRGFGTAIMHGGTTALFGILTKTLHDRAAVHRFRILLPGLLLACFIHALYNHFLLPPLLSTVSLLLILPALIVLVFQQSERYTRDWLGVGFDSDQELLTLITTGGLPDTRIGLYLHTLKRHFPGEIVADMLCLLRIQVELSIRAKGILLMRQAGFHAPPHADVREKFAELRYLEESIGTTGMLALSPFLHTTSQDLWQMHLLAEQG